MHIQLENIESQKAQEIGDLIRSYNSSKREAAESEPLNLYIEGWFSSRDFRELVRNRVFVCEGGLARTRDWFPTIATSRKRG